MITPIAVSEIMAKVFGECDKLRDAGQKEYAHNESNALANFERVATNLGISREHVLYTYLYKHLDGIASYIKGHKSQRENVEGRINDAIVYLVLLRCMVEESKSQNVNSIRQFEQMNQAMQGMSQSSGRL